MSSDNVEQLYILKKEDSDVISAMNAESFKFDPYLNFLFYGVNEQDKKEFILDVEEAFVDQLVDHKCSFSFDSTFKCTAMLLPPMIDWNDAKWTKFTENQAQKLLNKGYPESTVDRIKKVEDFFFKKFEEYKGNETYYLLTLATNVLHRKQGLASKLLNQLFEIFDREQKICYLECTDIVNVGFYQKHDFILLCQEKLPKSDNEDIPDSNIPIMSFMHRLPKSINK